MNQLQAHHVLWVLLGEEEAADLEAEAERRPTPVELLTAGTAEKLDANYAGTPCILPQNVHFFPKGVMEWRHTSAENVRRAYFIFHGTVLGDSRRIQKTEYFCREGPPCSPPYYTRRQGIGTDFSSLSA